MLRTPRLAVCACCLISAVLLAGCGDRSESRPVQLVLLAPTDASVSHESSVEVRGRVKPRGARVLVLGQTATVTGGRFRALVPLRDGSNVIDVGAFADGAAPSWAAVRVERRVLVEVPDLAGAPREQAVERLEAAGLRAEIHEEGGLLDQLLGGAWFACDTAPGPGAEVARGTIVQLTVSRTC
jgi:PASTA domain/Glucodextranase, domain B